MSEMTNEERLLIENRELRKKIVDSVVYDEEGTLVSLDNKTITAVEKLLSGIDSSIFKDRSSNADKLKAEAEMMNAENLDKLLDKIDMPSRDGEIDITKRTLNVDPDRLPSYEHDPSILVSEYSEVDLDQIKEDGRASRK